jgi:hypothetical protein
MPGALQSFLAAVRGLQNYPMVPAPERPSGGPMNVYDAEVERGGQRLAFTDEDTQNNRVDAYVLTVGAPPFPAWFQVVPLRSATTAFEVVDGSGQLLTAEEFPNGLEWSACAGDAPWLVYSAWAGARGNSAVQILRRLRDAEGEWGDAPAQDAAVLQFDSAATDDRYFFASSSSAELTERIYLFVRQDPNLAWNDDVGGSPKVCWCVDRGSASTIQHELVTVPVPINVASSPIRLVPDVYACVALVEVGLHFELQWWSLWEDPAAAAGTASHRIQTLWSYPSDATPEMAGTFPVSVGCRRYGTSRQFLVYAMWQQDTGVLGVQRSWIDSFVVSFGGQLGGSLPTSAPTADEADIVLCRRLTPALDPADGKPFLVDDETFTNPADGLPYVVASTGAIGNRQSASPQPVRFHTPWASQLEATG